MQQSMYKKPSQSKKDIRKAEVKQLYEKCFQYRAAANWQVPPLECCYSEYYQIDELQQLKERLNCVKSKLNNYTAEEWSAHTRRRDPSGEVLWRLKTKTEAEFVTVAWCKFYECLQRYELVQTSQKLRTLHLCEAPGAFIAALNHYLHTEHKAEEIDWKWLATTLNPYYEGNTLNKMIIDERFILYTMDNWLFHNDFTGNIIDLRNIESMKQECDQKLGDVQLITADGSIDCADVPSMQEDVVSTLHFAELITALSVLANKGNFVIKMFTMFESSSVCFMYLLNLLFQQVHVYKPATSKRGNSEVYVICLGFKKDTPKLQSILELMKSRLIQDPPNSLPLFAKSELPREFLMQHEICCRLFMNYQIRAIDMNIYAFECRTKYFNKEIHMLRTEVAKEYYERYNIKPLAPELCILAKRQANGDLTILQKHVVHIHKGSYTQRELLKDNDIIEQTKRLCVHLNDLEKAQIDTCENLHMNSITEADDSKLTLKINRGAAITKLRSSLLVSVNVWLLHLDLLNSTKIDSIHKLNPQCFIDDSFDVAYNTYTDQFNEFHLAQQSFWVVILKSIIETQAQSLSFINFPFVTHYSASVLKYLMRNFYKTHIIVTRPQFSITLTSPHADVEELRILLEILSADGNIHSVLELKELHRNSFSKTIVSYNDALLLKSFRSIL